MDYLKKYNIRISSMFTSRNSNNNLTNILKNCELNTKASEADNLFTYFDNVYVSYILKINNMIPLDIASVDGYIHIDTNTDEESLAIILQIIDDGMNNKLLNKDTYEDDWDKGVIIDNGNEDSNVLGSEGSDNPENNDELEESEEEEDDSKLEESSAEETDAKDEEDATDKNEALSKPFTINPNPKYNKKNRRR